MRLKLLFELQEQEETRRVPKENPIVKQQEFRISLTHTAPERKINRMAKQNTVID
jgi:hypothetical protein